MAKEFGNLTYANYSPQYVGQDIEGIKALSAKADESYNTNLGRQDAMELAINDLYSKVRSQNSPYVKAAYDKAQVDLKSIKDSGRWEDAQYKIQKSAKDFAMNNNVKGALMDKQAYDSWLSELNKKVGMKPEEGGITTEQRDNAVRMSLNNPTNKQQAKFNNETLSFDGIFKGYSPVKYRDIGTRMFDLAKDWKADETPFLVNRKEAKYIPSLGGYFTTLSNERVDEAEVNKALRQSIMSNPEDMAYIQEQEMFHKENNFKNSDGTYRTPDETDIQKLGYTKEYLAKEGIDIDSLNAKDKESLYNNISRNKTLDSYIEPASSKASYDKIKAHYVKDWISEVYLKDKLRKKAEEESATAGIETFANDKVDNVSMTQGLEGTALEGVEFDDSGNLKAAKMGDKAKVIGMEGTPVIGDDGKAKRDSKGNIIRYKHGSFDMKTNQDRVNFIINLQKQNPALKGLTPRQVAEAYSMANQSGTQISNESHSLGGLNTKKITSDLVKDLNGRQILVDDEQGDGTLSGAIEKLGLSEDEVKEKLLQAQTVSVLPTSNNRPGSYKVQIQDSKGIPRTVTISTSNEQQSYYDVVDKMAQNEKTGKTGFTTFVAQDPNKINKNKGKIDDYTTSEYGSVTAIVPDNKGGYMYSTRGGKIYSKEDTDNYIKVSKQTKEQLEQAGAIFTDDGRLMQNLSGKEIMKDATTNWLGSPYNIKNRVNKSKNPIEFIDESDIEEQ